MDKLFRLTFCACPNGYSTDGFHIGLFATPEEAEEVAARYRKDVPGFKDYDCNVRIIASPIIGDAERIEKVYCFEGWNTNEDQDEVDIIMSSCFVDLKEAEAALEAAKKSIPREEWVLNCHTIGQCEWQEGFSRVGSTITRNSCYTYFKIVGDFDPDHVTQLLGLQPDKSWKIGDERRNGTKYDFAAWHFGICDEYDPCVEEQMRKTIAPLLDKIATLNQIRQENDVSFYLEVVPTIYVGDTNPCLAPSLEVIDFCHETRTEMDIDMYVMSEDDE